MLDFVDTRICKTIIKKIVIGVERSVFATLYTPRYGV